MRRGGDKAASQVVKNLPLRQHRQRIAFAVSIRNAARPPQPPDKLPVAANQRAPAGHVGAVGAGNSSYSSASLSSPARVSIPQADRGSECGLRKAPIERALEGVDVVNALADKRALRRKGPGTRPETVRVYWSVPGRRRTGVRTAIGWCPAG